MTNPFGLSELPSDKPESTEDKLKSLLKTIIQKLHHSRNEHLFKLHEYSSFPYLFSEILAFLNPYIDSNSEIAKKIQAHTLQLNQKALKEDKERNEYEEILEKEEEGSKEGEDSSALVLSLDKIHTFFLEFQKEFKEQEVIQSDGLNGKRIKDLAKRSEHSVSKTEKYYDRNQDNESLLIEIIETIPEFIVQISVPETKVGTHPGTNNPGSGVVLDLLNNQEPVDNTPNTQKDLPGEIRKKEDQQRVISLIREDSVHPILWKYIKHYQNNQSLEIDQYVQKKTTSILELQTIISGWNHESIESNKDLLSQYASRIFNTGEIYSADSRNHRELLREIRQIDYSYTSKEKNSPNSQISLSQTNETAPSPDTGNDPKEIALNIKEEVVPPQKDPFDDFRLNIKNNATWSSKQLLPTSKEDIPREVNTQTGNTVGTKDLAEGANKNPANDIPFPISSDPLIEGVDNGFDFSVDFGNVAKCEAELAQHIFKKQQELLGLDEGIPRYRNHSDLENLDGVILHVLRSIYNVTLNEIGSGVIGIRHTSDDYNRERFDVVRQKNLNKNELEKSYIKIKISYLTVVISNLNSYVENNAQTKLLISNKLHTEENEEKKKEPLFKFFTNKRPDKEKPHPRTEAYMEMIKFLQEQLNIYISELETNITYFKNNTVPEGFSFTKN